MQQQQKYLERINEILQADGEIVVRDVIVKVLEGKLLEAEIQKRLNALEEDGEYQQNEGNVFQSKGWGERVAAEADVAWVCQIVRKVQHMKQSIDESPPYIQHANNLPPPPADHSSKQTKPIQQPTYKLTTKKEPVSSQKQQFRPTPNSTRKKNHQQQQNGQHQSEIVDSDEQKQEQDQQLQQQEQPELQQYHREGFDQYHDNEQVQSLKQKEQQPQARQQKKVEEQKRQPSNDITKLESNTRTLSPKKINNVKATIKVSPTAVISTRNQKGEYQQLTAKLTRFLVLAYHQYVLEQNSSANKIFDKSSIFKRPLMQLTLFLKFYKDFDLRQMLKVNEGIKLFKKCAVNHLWVDVGLFVELAMRIVEMKMLDGNKGVMKVGSLKEIAERVRMVLKLCDTAKVKNVLKAVQKQTWDSIMIQYQQRNAPEKTVEQDITNKTEVVDKFLERNFALEVPKWIGKKQHPESKSRVKPQPTPTRDYKSISSSIKQLRSKSERNLTKLKSMLDDNFNGDLQLLINKKSDQQSVQTPGKKVPLHKNTKQNSISVYKEIEQYLNDNCKMKVERSFLNKELRIMEDEPYLNAYFSNELKVGKEKIGDQKKVKEKVKGSMIEGKDKQRQLKNIPGTKPLPMIKKQQKSPPKQQNLTPYNNREEQAFTPLQSSSIRKKGSLSQPQIHSVHKVKPSRIYSMKKFMSPGGNKVSDNKNSMQKDAKAIVPANNNNRNRKGQSKLSEVEKQLVNKKLQELLIKSKARGANVSVLGNNKATNQKNSPAKDKPNPPTKSSTQPHEKLLESSSPIPKSKLMQEFRPEVYELFKGFEKRGKEEEQIVVEQNEKRKGYLKQSNVRVK